MDKLPLYLLEELTKYCKNFYSFSIQVQDSHLDELNHVNNVIYLQWFLEGAKRHSESLGFDMKKYLELGGAFFVKKHEIEYNRPSMRGDDLVLVTYTGEIRASSAVRHYRLYKDKGSSVELLAFGQTFWVYVDLKNGRPTRIPSIMTEKFADNRIQAAAESTG